MDNLIVGVAVTGLAVAMLALAIVVHTTQRRRERDLNEEYAEELLRFYHLLYGDEIPPDDITPPKSLEELKRINKKIEKYVTT